MREFINIGGDCSIPIDSIECLLEGTSAQTKRKISDWRETYDFVDVSGAKKLRCFIVTHNKIYGSNFSRETIHKRCQTNLADTADIKEPCKE